MYVIPEERIKILLQRYLSDILTMEERIELSDLILKFPEVWDRLQEMESAGLIPPAFQQQEEAEIKEGLARAKEAIRQAKSIPTARKGHLKKILSYTATKIIVALSVAAAALFLILNLTLWKRKPPKADGPVIAANPATNDVPPGGNKAMLTTADGRSFQLDSTWKGYLQTQGVSGPVKKDSGTVSYADYAEGNPFPAKKWEEQETTDWNKITTPAGGQFRVVLSDGTSVCLNNGSSLYFPTLFSGATRNIRVKGEAYVEVKGNASQPFTVMVNEQQIVVLGTSFNIKAYDTSKAVTTVITGRVKISKGDQDTLLGAKSQVSVDGDRPWKIKKDVNTDQIIGWEKGSFIFTGMPLSAILPELARWYDIEVNNNLSGDPVYDVALNRNQPLSGVLKCLEKNNPKAHFRIEGRKILVTN